MHIIEDMLIKLVVGLKLPQSMDNNFGLKVINQNYSYPFRKHNLGSLKNFEEEKLMNMLIFCTQLRV